MEVKGYKGFFKEKKNQKGEDFEEGKTYTVEDGEVFFGARGHGFHFCKHLEDCFTYFRPEYSIYAEVTGSGNVKVKDDETTDSYGICVSSKLTIDHFLTREEIIDIYLGKKGIIPTDSLKKFISIFDLTEEEIEIFMRRYYKEYSTVELLLSKTDKDVYKDKIKTYKLIKEIQDRFDKEGE